MRTYTTTQVATLLGYDRRTILRKCADRTIPAARIGDGHYRISGEWVQRMLVRLGKAPAPAPAGRS